MPIFQLVIQSSEDVPYETLQFIAADVPGALTFASQYRSPLPAELWQGGKRVCTLIYSEQDASWVIASQDSEQKTN